jgi:succinoglycan biosynthesis transport protein ExoP
MELRQYAATLWKWSWLIVLSTAVAAVCSWLAAKDQPPIYQTSTTLMIGQAMQQADPNYADFYTSEQLAQTYSELVKREPILKATARALGFEQQWSDLKEQIAVSLIAGTQLMEIRVTDTNPQRAKLIADELAQQLSNTVAQSQPQDSNRAFIQSQAATFPAKIEAAQQEIQKLEQDLAGAFSARQIQDIQSQINTLQNQVNTWQATFAQYQLLLGRGSANVLSVIEEAAVPTTPIGAGWKLQVLLAAAIGMVLAVAAAFLLEYLDDTIKTPADVDQAMHLTTLVGISRIPGEKLAEKLITTKHPKSPISEAYRVLRTNLQFSSLDEPVRTLLITSPNPVEGKSTTVANLGVVMAQTGKSVIVVDADLRRPVLHRIFGVENEQGLTDALLSAEPSLDGHLQPTGVDNLRLLTTGPLPPNPSELLGSQRMATLIERLKEQADVVLFDSPPSLAVTDASVLATQTDGVLIVADAGRTRRTLAKESVARFQQVGANLLGVVLNRLRVGRSGYYYYYYYYYYGDGKKRRRRRGLARFLPRLRRRPKE